MVAWWDSLSLAAQIFACVAIPATLVLIVQTILMLIGADSEAADTDTPDFDDTALDTDVDATSDGDIFDGDIDVSGMDALRLFTVRGIIAFLVVFGWTGYGMENAGIPLWITAIVSTVCGLLMMLLLALFVRAIMKLRNDGNLDNRNALGVSGKVYLTVPANRKGEGKVNVMLQGSYVEREAVTDDDTDIPTGCEVVVCGISGRTTLVVSRK